MIYFQIETLKRTGASLINKSTCNFQKVIKLFKHQLETD